MSKDSLVSFLDSHKRLAFGHPPTPLEPLERLSSWLGGPRIMVKRDDSTGLGMSGSKVRALEDLVPEALDQGAAALDTNVEVIGIDIDADPSGVRARVAAILCGIADDLGMDYKSLDSRIVIEERYSEGAYGVAGDSTLEAITQAAKREALVVDPVYSGKGLAGLIGLVREQRFSPSDAVLFLHTGGSPALYAYRSLFPELDA